MRQVWVLLAVIDSEDNEITFLLGITRDGEVFRLIMAFMDGGLSITGMYAASSVRTSPEV